MYNDIINYLSGKRIAILGFGSEGRSTYNFIRKYSSMELDILDVNDIEFGFTNCNVITGSNYLDDLDKYDIVIKSPGVSMKGISYDNVISNYELVLRYFNGVSIGITGTKGKSTTTSLIYNIIKEQHDNTYIVGNIGYPIFDYIDKYNDDTYLVIEMSSHMLETMRVSPNVSIMLNLYEDHLDHDGNVSHYHHNKLNIFKYQKENDIAIYNCDNDYIVKYLDMYKYDSKLYGITNGNCGDIYYKDNCYYYKDILIYDKSDSRKLLGEFNVYNIVFALTCVYLLGFDLDRARCSTREFEPVKYRLMNVGTYHDITFYSDTLTTIPDGTICSVEALGDVNTLIFGGMDRGISYDNFISYLDNCDISNLICMPTTGYEIGKRLDSKKRNILYCDTLEEAVKIAYSVTDKGSICLLSPAASSYEYFKNYKEKADKYIEYIKEFGSF